MKHRQSTVLPRWRSLHKLDAVLRVWLTISLFLLPLPPSARFSFADDEPPPADTSTVSTDPNAQGDGTSGTDPGSGADAASESANPLQDSDGDGITDADEVAMGSDPHNPDTDYDGLSDFEEVNLTHTSPTSADSDGNGVSDYNEFYGCYTVNTLIHGVGVLPYDWDGDGIRDPEDPNPLSATDNGWDTDQDGVPDAEDSDPSNSTLWNDWNRDGWNDDAEPPSGGGVNPNDFDGDGIANEGDSHPDDPFLWNDWDYNGVNDDQEDSDGDGVLNSADSHPNDRFLWCDWNGNGVNDDQESGLGDSDGDGYPDCNDSHPFNASYWNDWNGNGINDELEGPGLDSDGDNQPDVSDSDPNNPALWNDWNRNGVNDSEETTDPDSDGDGHSDSVDSDPSNASLWNDWNRNGLNDNDENIDSDGDGHPDFADTDPYDAALWNDQNRNGQNDESEVSTLDTDGDNVADAYDSHPYDADLWSDWNQNGTNDENETQFGDSDGDGYLDNVDTHPLNASLWNDHNDDGINDEQQTPLDSDNDGIPDSQDAYPLDFDNDGLPDAEEAIYGGDPGNADTDGDGLPDGVEAYTTHTSLTNVDSDGDGVTDYEEIYIFQTDPLVANQVLTTSTWSPKGESPKQMVADASAKDGVTLNDVVTLISHPPSFSQLVGFLASSAMSVLSITKTLPSGKRSTLYNQTLSSSGGTASYKYAVSSGILPTGLTLSLAGNLAGKPTEAGVFNFRVTVTDSAVPATTAFRDYSVTIVAPTIVISPGTLPIANTNTAYSKTFTASGGTGSYTYTYSGTLPAGLTLSSSGKLSGTPTAASIGTFTVTATDATGETGSQEYIVPIVSKAYQAALSYKAANANAPISLTDSDGDGIPDAIEDLYYPLLNPNTPKVNGVPNLVDAAGDLDGDGISNLDAYLQGKLLHSNSTTTDWDGDGIPNTLEAAHGLNQYDLSDAWEDWDHDRLTNLEEVMGVFGTQSRKLAPKTDPKLRSSPYSAPHATGGDGTARYNIFTLSDGDIREWLEYVEKVMKAVKLSSVAFDYYTGDQFPGRLVPDGYAVWVMSEGTKVGNVWSRPTINGSRIVGTVAANPLVSDADGDDMPDWWELKWRFTKTPGTTFKLDPRSDADSQPTDPSDFVNLGGVSFVTPYNLANAKTARPTSGNAQTLAARIAAWDSDHRRALLDPDQDGLSNLDEYRNGTNPYDADTDNDGVNDGIEVLMREAFKLGRSPTVNEVKVDFVAQYTHPLQAGILSSPSSILLVKKELSTAELESLRAPYFQRLNSRGEHASGGIPTNASLLSTGAVTWTQNDVTAWSYSGDNATKAPESDWQGLELRIPAYNIVDNPQPPLTYTYVILSRTEAGYLPAAASTDWKGVPVAKVTFTIDTSMLVDDATMPTGKAWVSKSVRVDALPGAAGTAAASDRGAENGRLLLTPQLSAASDQTKRLTLVPSAEGTLQEVSFTGDANQYLTMAMDPSESPNYNIYAAAFTAPQWIDADGDGLPETNHSVAYVRNSKPKISGKFSIPNWTTGQKVKVRLTGFSAGKLVLRTSEISVTPKIVTPGAVPSVSLAYQASTVSLPNTVEFFGGFKPVDPLDNKFGAQNKVGAVDPDAASVQDTLVIYWETQIDSNPWSHLGTSRHTLYVTLAKPPNDVEHYFETLYLLACKNAKQKSTVDAVVAGTWSGFQPDIVGGVPAVTNATGETLRYYSSDWANRTSVWGYFNEFPTATYLLMHKDGRCANWAHLLESVLKMNGISSTIINISPPQKARDAFTSGSPIKVSQAIERDVPTKEIFMVKGSWQIPVFDFNNLADIQRLISGRDNLNTTKLPGQGNQAPAVSRFQDHVILKVGSKFYDPSYGTGPFVSTLDWEIKSIEAFGMTTSFDKDSGTIYKDLLNDVDYEQWIWKLNLNTKTVPDCSYSP